MITRLVSALVCFLLALHEYFLGSLEGAQPNRDGIVTALLSGDFAAGPLLLVAFGLFLMYRAWEAYKDRRDRRSSVKHNA
ncbi:MAG TPA: hypothetical protein VJO34_08195 [Methylomirabilota bacterium]|jgi:hypothetical protein|nr:hypothetical protein [Methylomirabilota bacterium]